MSMLAQCGTGSPPQVRGKLKIILGLIMFARITPAGAGKTALYNNYCEAAKDHPRRCGENRIIHQFRLRCKGSPPQVRGKLIEAKSFVDGIRITPAGAGKTSL